MPGTRRPVYNYKLNLSWFAFANLCFNLPQFYGSHFEFPALSPADTRPLLITTPYPGAVPQARPINPLSIMAAI